MHACFLRCTVATFARHSGGHLNPAISLAAALSGHMAWGAAGMYMLAQVRLLLANAVKCVLKRFKAFLTACCSVALLVHSLAGQ
jgi:hypothetical protein